MHSYTFCSKACVCERGGASCTATLCSICTFKCGGWGGVGHIKVKVVVGGAVPGRLGSGGLSWA